MTSDKFSEIAILLHDKLPNWPKDQLLVFVKEMVAIEGQLTKFNSRLLTSLNTEDVKAREAAKVQAREAVFNSGWAKQIGPYTFDTNPADAAIKFNVGKRYSNHADGVSLTFKIQ